MKKLTYRIKEKLEGINTGLLAGLLSARIADRLVGMRHGDNTISHKELLKSGEVNVLAFDDNATVVVEICDVGNEEETSELTKVINNIIKGLLMSEFADMLGEKDKVSTLGVKERYRLLLVDRADIRLLENTIYNGTERDLRLLGNDKSLANLKREDYEAALEIAARYHKADYDYLRMLAEQHPLDTDLIIDTLSALQIHVSEGGAKTATIEALPEFFTTVMVEKV